VPALVAGAVPGRVAGARRLARRISRDSVCVRERVVEWIAVRLWRGACLLACAMCIAVVGLCHAAFYKGVSGHVCMFAGSLCSGALVILTQWVAAACLALLLAVMMAPLLVWSAQAALRSRGSRGSTAAKQANSTAAKQVKPIEAKAPVQANAAEPAPLPPPHGCQASSCARDACRLTTTPTPPPPPSSSSSSSAPDCGKWYCPKKAASVAEEGQVEEDICMEMPNSSKTVDKSRRRIRNWYTTIIQR